MKHFPEECSVYLAIEHELAIVCIEDPLRKEAADVVRALKAAGLEKVVMMTETVKNSCFCGEKSWCGCNC